MAPEPGLVPKERYLTRDFAQAEARHLWPRVWLHAAALDLLREPGAFVTVELGAGDLLLVRDGSGAIRAFHNVCLHRGRRLVDARHGTLKTLRCPLHHWQYNLDGSLAHVPDREVFGPLVNDGLRLKEVTCAKWGGQAWVHFGEPEQPLLAWLGPAAAALEPFDLERYALKDQVTFDVPCNWKTGADQFNEGYHIRAVHPHLLGAIDDTSTSCELAGPHALQRFSFGRPSPRVAHREISDSLAELLRQNGVDPKSIDGDVSRAPDALRRALRDRGVDRLADDELLTGQSWFLFPSVTFNAYAHMLMMHRYRPHPDDPERMWLDQLTFFRVDADEARPAPEVRFVERPGEGSGGPVIDEDVRHIVAVQRGMHSPAFANLRLGGHELCSLHMHATIDRYLGSTDCSSGPPPSNRASESSTHCVADARGDLK